MLPLLYRRRHAVTAALLLILRRYTTLSPLSLRHATPSTCFSDASDADAEIFASHDAMLPYPLLRRHYCHFRRCADYGFATIRLIFSPLLHNINRRISITP